ncbi:unnamed protein product [Caretta caretta]
MVYNSPFTPSYYKGTPDPKISMTSQSQGIQQLLQAEKRAKDKLEEAKKRKGKRLKQAKEEAIAEIDHYRLQREREFRHKQSNIMGSQEYSSRSSADVHWCSSISALPTSAILSQVCKREWALSSSNPSEAGRRERDDGGLDLRRCHSGSQTTDPPSLQED